MIPKYKCQDRRLYRIKSRNLEFGVFKAETGGFLGLREKFGDIYVFQEYHRDNGSPFGTVSPTEELPEILPEEIENKEYLGSFCSKCEKRCGYIDFPDGKREITLSSGHKMEVSGQWEHLEPTDCTKPLSYAKSNKPLHLWLETMEKKYKKPL